MRPDSSIQWSAYPSLLLAAAFATGVAVDALVSSPGLYGWFGLALGNVLLLAGVEWWNRVRMVTPASFGRVVAVALMTVAAGGSRNALDEQKSPRSLTIVAEKGDDDVTLEGVVRNAPERTNGATRFTLIADTLVASDTHASVEGTARVTLRSSPWAKDPRPFPTVREGDIMQLEGLLRPPHGLRNPGGFNYRAYLDRRGVCCTLYVDHPDDVQISGNRRGILEAGVVSAREYIRTQIGRYIPSEDSRAVLRALLLGDRSRISDEQRDRFAKTGLMHLLAVSGLHAFLVGMVLYLLLRPVLTRVGLHWQGVEVGRAALTIGLLGFYMVLTGSRPSVVRAVIMAGLLIGGTLFQRSAHPLNTLGVAAAVLLAIRPGALFDVGFQLSMAAVAGIVSLNRRFLEIVPEELRASQAADWLVQTTTTSGAAILGTAPVLLYHFGWVSASGLALNVAGIPCTGLALGAAFLMTMTGGLSATVAAAFGGAADLFVRGLLAVSQYGAELLSWAGIRMPVPDPWLIGSVASLLLVIAQWPRPRNRWRWAMVALLLASLSIWTDALSKNATPTLDAVFFDVGQGDAALFSTPDNSHLLVDTGPRSPTGSAAEFTVLPYLERRGIDRIDAVVITHPDEDHLGGLPTILREVSVARVVRSGRSADTELYNEVRTMLREKNIPTRVVRRGDTMSLGPSVRVQVLGPPGQPSLWGLESRNEMSVVTHVAYGGVDFLLSGDIEAAAERNLVATYGHQLESRVVKVPHHGSRTSSTAAFVEAVAPSGARGRAVVSVGRGEQYGMPSREVLSRWSEEGVTVHVTAEDGAVWLRSDGTKGWLPRWK